MSVAETGKTERDFSDDPRTCAKCQCDLFPNWMEGAWEHFQKNGCIFSGKAAHSVEGEPQTNIEMLGPFRSELKGAVTQ